MIYIFLWDWIWIFPKRLSLYPTRLIPSTMKPIYSIYSSLKRPLLFTLVHMTKMILGRMNLWLIRFCQLSIFWTMCENLKELEWDSIVLWMKILILKMSFWKMSSLLLLKLTSCWEINSIWKKLSIYPLSCFKRYRKNAYYSSNNSNISSISSKWKKKILGIVREVIKKLMLIIMKKNKNQALLMKRKIILLKIWKIKICCKICKIIWISLI